MKLTINEKTMIRQAYSETAGPTVQKRRIGTHNYEDDIRGGMVPGSEPSFAPLYRSYKTSLTCPRQGYIHNGDRMLSGGVTIRQVLSLIISFIDERRRGGALHRGDDGMAKEGKC